MGGAAGLPDYVRTVRDVVVETLVAWGVTQVFGIGEPGSSRSGRYR